MNWALLGSRLVYYFASVMMLSWDHIKKKIKNFLLQGRQLKTSTCCPLQFQIFPPAFSVLMISKISWESFLAALVCSKAV